MLPHNVWASRPMTSSSRAWALLAVLMPGCSGLYLAQTASVRRPVSGSAPVDHAAAHDARNAAIALFLRTHDSRAAAKATQAAIQLDPNYAAAWFDLAIYSEASRDWPTAVKGFGRYLVLSPSGTDAPRATHELAIVKKYVVKPPTQIQLDNTAYDASLVRARVLIDHGMNQDAVLELGSAEQLLPRRWEAYAIASACMAFQGKLDVANQLQQMALDRAPKDKQDQIKEVVRASMR